MLITKEVEVKWNVNNKDHYVSLGYIFTKINDTFIANVDDLSKGSHKKICYSCDYCGREFEKEFKQLINGRKVIKKDSCAKCQPYKTQDVLMIECGVNNKTKLPETLNKMKSTMLDRYGVEHNMQMESCREKAKLTWIENYGVDNPTKNKDIHDLAMRTYVDRYGENPHKNPIIVARINATNQRKYGCDWQLQSPEVIAKSRRTFYKNGTTPTSRQQKYIHELLGGQLNFPVSNCNLDVAYPQNNIYIEFNGSGHSLSVKLGDISQKQFNTKEIKRYLYLKSKGWKCICIESSCDYLPSDEVIVDEFNKAGEWFKSNDRGHYHYNVEIGNKIDDINHGKLRRITDKDLKGDELNGK